MFPYDGRLSEFLRAGGTEGVRTFAGVMNNSTLVITITFVSLIALTIAIILCLQKKVGPTYIVVVLITGGLATPVSSGMPAGFIFFDYITGALSSTLSDAVKEMSTKLKSDVPLNYVYESVVGASTCSLESNERDLAVMLAKYCTPPVGKTTSGHSITPLDLFNGEINSDGSLRPNFPISLLNNRKVYIGGEFLNCAELHKSVTIMLRKKSLEKVTQVNKSNKLATATKKYLEEKGYQHNLVNQNQACLSFDLLSTLSGEYKNTLNKGLISEYTNEMLDLDVISSTVSTYFSSVYEGFQREAGIYRVKDRNKMLNNYRKMMANIPYTLSIAYVILMILFVIIVYLPLLTGSFYFLKIWIFAFTGLKVSAWILVFLRVIFNTILINHKHLGGLEGANFFGSLGNIDVSHSFAMGDEMPRLIMSYLEAERTIINVLFMGIPGAAMLSSPAKSAVRNLIGKGAEIGKETLKEGITGSDSFANAKDRTTTSIGNSFTKIASSSSLKSVGIGAKKAASIAAKTLGPKGQIISSGAVLASKISKTLRGK